MANIMVVTDDQDYADLLFNFLKADGYDISVVSSADAAFEKIKEKRPDLVLLDVTVPEEKAASFNLARAVQRQQTPRVLPIIMLTGVNDEYPFNFKPQDLDSEWFPVSDLMEKPVDFDILREKISALLKRIAMKNQLETP